MIEDRDLNPTRIRRVVIDVVSRETGISSQEIIGPRKSRPIFWARFMCIGIVDAIYTDVFSLPALGRMFNRDHTSIMHARERLRDLLSQKDGEFSVRMGRALATCREMLAAKPGDDVDHIEDRAIWFAETLARAVRRGLLNDARQDPIGFCRHYEAKMPDTKTIVHPKPAQPPPMVLPVTAPQSKAQPSKTIVSTSKVARADALFLQALSKAHKLKNNSSNGAQK